MNILGGLVKTTTRSLYTNASRISMFILVKTHFCIHTADICTFQTICTIRNWYVYTNTITRFPLPNTALPGRKALRWIVSPKTLCAPVGRVSLTPPTSPVDCPSKTEEPAGTATILVTKKALVRQHPSLPCQREVAERQRGRRDSQYTVRIRRRVGRIRTPRR